ncbi:MAG: radical SAM/SPASM domain-containing protein [bacterium]
MRPQQADNRDRVIKTHPSDSPGHPPRWRMPYAQFPRCIQLETVTTCNGKCPFCPQHEIQRSPARMADATWRKIVDDSRGRGVTYRPFLTNEPFVDRRQPEIVRYIKQTDPTALVEYNTNGELLTETLGRDLLTAGMGLIRFSIDGLSREVYEPSRVGVSHATVYGRVARFLELWDREGFHDQCRTEVRLIEVPENRHEIEDFRRFWEPRCSEVVITQLYQWPWTGQQPEDVVLKPCLKAVDELFFYSNGNATLCCWDVHERAIIGNVEQRSVAEIWQSHAASHLRELLDDGRRDLIHLCSRCNAYGGYDFSQFETR